MKGSLLINAVKFAAKLFMIKHKDMKYEIITLQLS